MITGEAKAKRNHEDRMSDSLIHNSCEVSKMSHLTKDHKLVGEDGLPPTRPVVSACPSERAQGVEVLSTEHMLQKLTAFNHKWNTAKPSTEPCLITTDAAALCPSIDHLSSAKIVRRKVMLSKNTVEATDWREMAPLSPDDSPSKTMGTMEDQEVSAMEFRKNLWNHPIHHRYRGHKKNTQWVFPNISPTNATSRVRKQHAWA